MRLRIMVRGMPLLTYLKGMPAFLKEYKTIRRQAGKSQEKFEFSDFYPCLKDKGQESGVLAQHYFLQDIYIAQKVFQNAPARHVDIGSRIDGFVAHVASFRQIEVLDVRELNLALPNISFTSMDLSSKDFPLTDYCDSLSCLHALEHFGLGRYGDPLDYEGHLTGWANMLKMLKKGGKLYLSVPIGPQRIEFNAHRVFSIPYLLDMIGDNYDINSFAYINDAEELIISALLEEPGIRDNFGCRFGCGIFELTKK